MIKSKMIKSNYRSGCSPDIPESQRRQVSSFRSGCSNEIKPSVFVPRGIRLVISVQDGKVVVIEAEE
jgi:hypothetical protein